MEYSGFTPPWALPPEQNPYYKKEQRKTVNRIGFALVLYLLFTSVCAVTIREVIVSFFPGIVPRYYQLINLLIMVVPSYLFGVPLFAGFLSGLPKKAPEKKPLRFKGWVTFLAVSFFLLIAGNYIAGLLMELFEGLRGEQITNQVSAQIDRSSPIFNFILMVIMAPIAEEIMCRKLLIDRLLPFSEFLAVVTSGLIFGLLHGNFYQFFYATFLGMVFGYVYVRTGRILPTILMHMLINFIGSIVSGFLNRMTSELASAPTSINPWDLVAGLYSVSMLVLAICGAILFFRKLSRHGLKKSGDLQLSLSTQFKLSWLNIGMITYCAICVVSFITSLYQ